MTVREKLAARVMADGSVPKLTDEQVALIVTVFQSQPTWDRVYLFHDGSLEGPTAGLRTVPGHESTSQDVTGSKAPHDTALRREQLVSIASRGFPVCIGRGHSQVRAKVCEPFQESP